MAISVPEGETRVLEYFQARMPLWAVRARDSIRNLWRRCAFAEGRKKPSIIYDCP
jgi:hypothetical protein